MSAFQSCNPATGEVFFQRPAWSEQQLSQAIDQLQQAQLAWAQLETGTRALQLQSLADELRKQRQPLAQLITQEVGKCTSECLAEIDKSEKLIRYYAQLAPDLLRPQAISTQASRSGVAFEPLGTVLAVMPWNYPVWQALRFAIPALMAGNACLIKPAPMVAATTQCLLDCFHAARLKVVDIAWIEPRQVEQALSRCQALAFTGSSDTGRQLAALAGRHLKKSVLELGGSNPFIVLADADIDRAAQEAAHSRYRDAGQSCNAAKRMIVVPEIAEAFIERFCAEARQLRTGAPDAASTTLGPLARADLRLKLHAQVEDALQQGATLRLGGELPQGPGFFYPATVIDHVNARCRLYHEEAFGPVASILRAHDEADAIRLANDTPFGLGATLYSQDENRAWQLAQQINAGSVFINRHTSSDLRLPFGGVKDSGYGRELSEFGLYEFVNVKTYWQK